MRSKQPFPVVGLAVLAATASVVLGQEAPVPSPAPSPAPAADAAPAPPPAEPGPESVDLQQAKDAFKKGSWQEARDAAAIVLQSQPRNLEALYIAGTSERQTNQLPDAEGHLKTLVEASPLFPLAHF